MKRVLVVALFLVSMAPAGFASCDKSFTERLNFVLDNAPTGFSAIRGPQRAGTQYELTPAGEAFCPKTYILNHYDVTKDRPENWNIKFTYYRPGTLDEVTLALAKEIGPALVSTRGYKDPKPFIKDGSLGGNLLEWDNPNGVDWVTVETWVDDESGQIWFVSKVWHDVK